MNKEQECELVNSLYLKTKNNKITWEMSHDDTYVSSLYTVRGVHSNKTEFKMEYKQYYRFDFWKFRFIETCVYELTVRHENNLINTITDIITYNRNGNKLIGHYGPDLDNYIVKKLYTAIEEQISLNRILLEKSILEQVSMKEVEIKESVMVNCK